MPRNIADCLSLDSPTVHRLLRACGTDEDILRDGSDCDRFLALANALPLSRGNPVAETLEKEAQTATGLTVPLCPHTAAAFWEAWTEIHWYGREFPSADALPVSCSRCAPAMPTVLHRQDVTELPNPLTLPRTESVPDLSALTRRLSDALPAQGYALLKWPSEVDFRRPDPYHATLALRALSEGVATDADRAVFLTQALRILGEAAKQRPITLLLCGGAPDAVASLLAYLSDCHRLPETVCLSAPPADIAHVSGLYPEVRTGYCIDTAEPETAIRRKRAAYARVAPIGSAFELRAD